MFNRVITENKSCRTATRHIAIAIHSIPIPGTNPRKEEHAFKVGAAISWRWEKGSATRRQEIVWWHPWEMMDWIARQLSDRETTWIWGHNVGRCLTLLRFWDLYKDGRFSLYSPLQQIQIYNDIDAENVGPPKGYLCLIDPPTVVNGWLQGCHIFAVDTRNWFDATLPELCAVIGAPMPPDSGEGNATDIIRRAASTDAYAIMGTATKLCRTVKECDLGVMKPTLAGQALQHWRHIKGRPQVGKTVNQAAVNLERAALFGTRADLFFCGAVKGPVYALDVNGCHGYIMSTQQLPLNCMDYTDAPEMNAVKYYAQENAAIATVDLNTYSPFPHRDQQIGVYWPTGYYTTTLCGPELKRAFDDGSVLRIHKAAHYRLGETCKKFADYWYQERIRCKREEDKLMAKLAKAMPCALYGKFCQTQPGWIPIGEIEHFPPFCAGNYLDGATGLWHPFRQIAGHAEMDMARELRSDTRAEDIRWRGPYRTRRLKESKWSFPAISAWITSHVRAYMDALIRAAGKGNVYYLCHDCIHVNSEGYCRLYNGHWMHETQQGMLKVKAKYDSVEYYGVNMLRVNGKLSVAGLPKSATEGPDGGIECWTTERLASALARMPDGTVRLRKEDCELELEYTRGEVLENGWIKPIHLGG